MIETARHHEIPASGAFFEASGAGGGSASPATVVLLAAGASRRMGAAKASLPFRGTETFLDHLLAVYARIGCDAIIVMAGRGGPFPLGTSKERPAVSLVAFNRNPDGDRLSSVRCGLAMAPRRRPVFVQDVDRPLVTESVLLALLAHCHPTGYAAPDIDGHAGHPLLLSPHVALRVWADRESTTLREALGGFERALVEVADRDCDVNINTPEEYRRHIPSEDADAS